MRVDGQLSAPGLSDGVVGGDQSLRGKSLNLTLEVLIIFITLRIKTSFLEISDTEKCKTSFTDLHSLVLSAPHCQAASLGIGYISTVLYALRHEQSA